MITLRNFVITVSSLLSVFLLIQAGFFYYASNKFDCNPYAMEFNRTANKNEQLNGLYSSSEGYFCVWTKDRKPEAIAETTFHELAHYYNYEEKEHFQRGRK